ncbi:unnamed protein product [Haemonchus placei]|uniref:Uncharacterized protein n=1 Tax=Haemonchus placei TaxID=6290 RepID=A0A0N4WUR3_HAEPC|nr:unnamed protein product [Haemonchus placei]
MSYTSRYSSSYSSRYGDTGRDSSSRYGSYSSRYSKDLGSSEEYSSPRESKYASSYRTRTYDTLEDDDSHKKSVEDEVDSAKDYSSSRYGKYSSRYTTSKDDTGSDDYLGTRESKYSSSYRSKYRDTTEDVDEPVKAVADDYEHDYSEKRPEETKEKKLLKQESEEKEEELEYQPDDTNLEVASEDVEEYAAEEEEAEVPEEDEVAQVNEGVKETIRSHASSVSSSVPAGAAEIEEKPKRQIEHKVPFSPSTDNSEPRFPKTPIENIVPKKRVSDLIARFNTGNITNGRSEPWKDKGTLPKRNQYNFSQITFPSVSNITSLLSLFEPLHTRCNLCSNLARFLEPLLHPTGSVNRTDRLSIPSMGCGRMS